VKEFQEIGNYIAEVLNVLSQKSAAEDALIEGAVREKVKALVSRFPIY
jgi:glycine hydroxymethyltransferase